jgi:uncharacterized repeat protein (TIGR03803 family)
VAARTASAQPAFKVLHSFGTTSLENLDSLIQAADGNFYGTTYNQMEPGLGAVFKMTQDGTYTVLHSFAGWPTDGAGPEAGLIQAANGNFYGTTFAGGAFNSGTVFEMTPEGTLGVLHTFAGGTNDGAYPMSALVQASDGSFYGTTEGGGSAGGGTGVPDDVRRHHQSSAFVCRLADGRGRSCGRPHSGHRREFLRDDRRRRLSRGRDGVQNDAHRHRHYPA